MCVKFGILFPLLYDPNEVMRNLVIVKKNLSIFFRGLPIPKSYVLVCYQYLIASRSPLKLTNNYDIFCSNVLFNL